MGSSEARRAAWVLLAMAVAAAGARSNPAAERKFLGGGVTMDLVLSDDAFPFATVPIRQSPDPRMRFRSVDAAAKHHLSALRASGGDAGVLSPAADAAAAGLQAAAALPSGTGKIAAFLKGSQMRMAETKAGAPRIMAIKEGKDDAAHPATANMQEAIRKLREEMDMEMTHLYGCAPGTRFAETFAIEAPEGDGFPQGEMVSFLRRHYDAAVAPSDCCTKRVRLGAGRYMPLKEFMAVMMQMAKDNAGGVMRVDLSEVFPPAFDFMCAAVAGYPDSVVRPSYRLTTGTQLAGALERVKRALATMLDICTAKTTGNPLRAWTEAAGTIRSVACDQVHFP